MATTSWDFYNKKSHAMRNYRAAEQRRMAGERQQLQGLYAQYKDLKAQYNESPFGSLERKGLEYEKEGLFAKILDLESSSTNYTDNNKSDFITQYESYTHRKIQNDSDFSMA